MMTKEDLKKVVNEYLEELTYQHPFVNSDKFVDNSYRKWACEEILNAIDRAENLPFELTTLEILDSFSEKMKRYAYMNSRNSLGFAIASETAEYLIEEYWLYDRKNTT